LNVIKRIFSIFYLIYTGGFRAGHRYKKICIFTSKNNIEIVKRVFANLKSNLKDLKMYITAHIYDICLFYIF